MSDVTDRLKLVSLYSTEGTSDKVYTMWIEPSVRTGTGAQMFLVQSQYGRRGGPMQSACKTPAAVPMAKAEAVYAKVLKEKLAKGYHEGKDAPAFSQVTDAKDSGLRPMLLTDCSEEGPDLFVADDTWVGQEKFNGKRIMIDTRDKDGKASVIGVNRRGLECPIPWEVVDTFGSIGQVVMDGELVGLTYHAFDLMFLDGKDLRSESYEKRHMLLEKLLAESMLDPCVQCAPVAIGAKDKAALVKKLRTGRKEGVVFKQFDETYQPGRIENAKKAIAVKCKFYAEGVFIVNRWNDKASVALDVMLDGRPFSVGNVTVQGKYASQVKPGAILRVKYLYATLAKQLYQPNLDPDDAGSVTRDDLTPDACTYAQLKFEGKDEE